LLNAIAITVSRDLWGDRINDIFSMGLLKAIAIPVSRDYQAIAQTQ
jgi:hypothetical protein